jgi:drug/metabolite transporter (DMT)-like permease
LAYFLYNHVLSKLLASQVVIIYTSLVLVFAALFGGLLLGEDLNYLQSGAILLILIGVAYSQGMELNQETVLTADESL